MYANKKNLAALFGVTTQTVQRRVKGIEKLIGDRYNQYAILDNLVSVAVYADYEKYHKCLEDKLTKKYVPPFDMKEYIKLIDRVKGSVFRSFLNGNNSD